jgi:hypothetical protein
MKRIGNRTGGIIGKFGLFNITGGLGNRVTLTTVLNLGYSVINRLKAMTFNCQSLAGFHYRQIPKTVIYS